MQTTASLDPEWPPRRVYETLYWDCVRHDIADLQQVSAVATTTIASIFKTRLKSILFQCRIYLTSLAMCRVVGKFIKSSSYAFLLLLVIPSMLHYGFASGKSWLFELQNYSNVKSHLEKKVR